MLKDELKYTAIALLNITEESAVIIWEHCTDEGAQRYYRYLYREVKESTLDAMYYCVLFVQMMLTLRQWLQNQDHEIPLYLEAPLKKSKPVQKALPPAKNEAIALLPPAKPQKVAGGRGGKGKESIASVIVAAFSVEKGVNKCFVQLDVDEAGQVLIAHNP